jgi:hypothetical protein
MESWLLPRERQPSKRTELSAGCSHTGEAAQHERRNGELAAPTQERQPSRRGKIESWLLPRERQPSKRTELSAGYSHTGETAQQKRRNGELAAPIQERPLRRRGEMESWLLPHWRDSSAEEEKELAATTHRDSPTLTKNLNCYRAEEKELPQGHKPQLRRRCTPGIHHRRR